MSESKVELLSPDDPRLTHFLEKNEHLLLHTPFYAHFISAAFQCEYHFVVAIDNDLVQAILPFVEVKSSVFGKRIISAPYLEYGGFAGDEKYISLILEWLAQKYKSSFDYLEIRGGIESFDTVLSSLTVKKNFYKRFVLDLRVPSPLSVDPSSSSMGSKEDSAPQKSNFAKFSKENIGSSVFNTVTFSSGSVPAVQFFRSNIQDSKRKAINKAKRNNVKVKDVPLADLDIFYNLYCQNMKRFGSPPYSKKYFREFYDHLVKSGLAKIYGAYIDGKIVAALLGLCYKERVHIIIAVSDDSEREYRPNDAVHSEFIEWSIENNFHFFDFGRVREESGQFEYKQKWGPLLLDLPSYFLIWNGKDIPEVDPKKYNLAVKLWRFLPLRVTKMIGHRLRKELGI